VSHVRAPLLRATEPLSLSRQWRWTATARTACLSRVKKPILCERFEMFLVFEVFLYSLYLSQTRLSPRLLACLVGLCDARRLKAGRQDAHGPLTGRGKSELLAVAPSGAPPPARDVRTHGPLFPGTENMLRPPMSRPGARCRELREILDCHRNLVPASDDASLILSRQEEDAPWEAFFTAAPARRPMRRWVPKWPGARY
jgi:hypothetical protein